MERLECKHCRDVIGVYEPMVIVTEAQARTTSRAAEHGMGDWPGDRYHCACYVKAHGEHPVPVALAG
jgi:hypothetical protein